MRGAGALSRGFARGLGIAGYWGAVAALAITPALAQSVTDDGTLGTVVTTNGSTYDITAGTQAGANQFHSFDQFSVPSGWTANFIAPLGTANIISRVTGGQLSQIDGTVRSDSSANLFLINPAGVVMGEGATIDVGGAFVASSASSVEFPTSCATSCSFDLGTTASTITVAEPAAFGFIPAAFGFAGQGSAATIEFGGELGGGVGGNSLTLSTFLNLSQRFDLIAWNADVFLPAGGRVETGTSDLTVVTNQLLSLDGGYLFDGSLTTFVFTGATESAGDITISAAELFLANGAKIISRTFGETDSGNIEINVADTLDIRDGAGGNLSGIGTEVSAGAVGAVSSGDIVINAETADVSVKHGAFISTGTYGPSGSSAGTISIFANTLTIDSQYDPAPNAVNYGAAVTSQAFPGSEGNAGDIFIDAGSLYVTDYLARIYANAAGGGASGDIWIGSQAAVDLIRVTGGAIISAATTGGIGGDVHIGDQSPLLPNPNGGQVTRVEVSGFFDSPAGDAFNQPSSIATATGGAGAAGDIFVSATEAVLVENFANFSAVTFGTQAGAGSAGNIFVDAPSVLLDNGSMSTATFGGGGGSIDIGSRGTVFLLSMMSGSTLRADVINGDGDAGGIFIDVGEATISNSILFSAANGAGTGDAGFIAVNALGAVEVLGSYISSDAANTGYAGGVTLSGSYIRVLGSIISTEVQHGSRPVTIGDPVPAFTGVQLTAADSDVDGNGVLVQNSIVSASTFGVADAGDVFINALHGDIRIELDSKIASAAQGPLSTDIGDAGSVQIVASGLLTVSGGFTRIVSSAGWIDLDLTGNSRSGSSGSGFAGEVKLEGEAVHFLGARIDADVYNGSRSVTVLDPVDPDGVSVIAHGVDDDGFGIKLIFGSIGTNGSFADAGPMSFVSHVGAIEVQNTALASVADHDADAGNVSFFSATNLWASGLRIGANTTNGTGASVSLVANNNISIGGGTDIRAETHGDGDAGTVEVSALTGGVYIGDSSLDSRAVVFISEQVGDAGSVRVSAAGGVTISNTTLSSSAGRPVEEYPGGPMLTSLNTGFAGSVTVEGTYVHLVDSNISTEVERGTRAVTLADPIPTFSGIRISAGGVDLNGIGILIENSEVVGSTYGTANAGSVKLAATGAGAQIHVLESNLSSTTSGLGVGGDIFIDAPSITVSGQGTTISTETSFLSATVCPRAQVCSGRGGNIRIGTLSPVGSLLVDDGATISSDTSGTSHGGLITIGSPPGNNSVNPPQGNDLYVGQLTLRDGARISASTSGAAVNPPTTGTAGDAGFVAVYALNLSIDGGGLETGLFSEVIDHANSTGAAGNVTVFGNAVELINGGQISSTNKGRGIPGGVNMTLWNLPSDSSSLLIDGGTSSVKTGVFAEQLDVSAFGNTSEYGGGIGIFSVWHLASNIAFGPDIDSKVGSIVIRNGGRISTSNESSDCCAGAISIGANTLSITGQGSAISSTSAANTNSPDAGAEAITILVDQLNMDDHALISSTTSAGASSGSIIIAGSAVHSLTNPFQVSGPASLAQSLSMAGGAVISATAEGSGNAGSVFINVTDLTMSDGSLISSQVIAQPNGTPNAGQVAGTIKILLHDLTMTSGAEISSSTVFGDGIVDNQDFTQLNSLAAAGNVFIGSTGGNLLMDDATISSFSQTFGAGGLVSVGSMQRFLTTPSSPQPGEKITDVQPQDDPSRAFNRIRLQNDSRITSEALGGSSRDPIDAAEMRPINAGDIQLNATGQVFLKNSTVESRISGPVDGVGGYGNGGYVAIDPIVFVMTNSIVNSSAGIVDNNASSNTQKYGGVGGAVFVRTDYMFRSQGVFKSDGTIDGQVEVTGPEVDASAGLLGLDPAILNVLDRLPAECSARLGKVSGSLTDVGRGGLPLGPFSFGGDEESGLLASYGMGWGGASVATGDQSFGQRLAQLSSLSGSMCN